MSLPLPVRISERATLQIEEAIEWWAEYRPKALGAVEDDVLGAIDLLTSHPSVGACCSNPNYPDLRRLHLRRIRYHLYYRVVGEPPAVEVVALWHSSRGSSPPM